MVTPPRVTRSSEGLRDALFDEIDHLRGEDSDPQRSLAVSKIASQILSSAKLEHEIAKYAHDEFLQAGHATPRSRQAQGMKAFALHVASLCSIATVAPGSAASAGGFITPKRRAATISSAWSTSSNSWR